MGDTTRVFEDDLHVTSPTVHRRLIEIVRRLTYCNAVFGLVRRDVLGRTALIASFPGSDVPLLYELAVSGRFRVVPEAAVRTTSGPVARGESVEPQHGAVVRTRCARRGRAVVLALVGNGGVPSAAAAIR